MWKTSLRPCVLSTAASSMRLLLVKSWLALACALPEVPFACGLATAHLLAEDAHQDEELLVDRHHPEDAALTRLGAQRVDDRVERLGDARRQRLDPPQALLAPRGEGEVDVGVGHVDLLRAAGHGRRWAPRCQSGRSADATRCV